MLRGGRHPLLSHNCTSLIDTLARARQMWAERYILVSEGNAGAMLEEDVETDVAIEDEW